MAATTRRHRPHVCRVPSMVLYRPDQLANVLACINGSCAPSPQDLFPGITGATLLISCRNDAKRLHHCMAFDTVVISGAPARCGTGLVPPQAEFLGGRCNVVNGNCNGPWFERLSCASPRNLLRQRDAAALSERCRRAIRTPGDPPQGAPSDRWRRVGSLLTPCAAVMSTSSGARRARTGDPRRSNRRARRERQARRPSRE